MTAAGILIAAIIIFVIVFLLVRQSDPYIPEERIAGMKGEMIADDIISQVLDKDDLLFTNVEISYNGKDTELDNIVVNKNGVFIIEVKNFSGILCGSEEDAEWTKYHTTGAGNTYSKTVRNPIKQVKRQIYILSGYLGSFGCRTWVDGFVFLVNGNRPFKSDLLLENKSDIDRAIHTPGRNPLTLRKISEISELLI